MNIRITPHKLEGSIKAISSKSVAHRILICAALANGKSKVEIDSTSADIEATVSALESLGAVIEKDKSTYTVEPINDANSALVDCNESGSTLRFLVPVAASLGKKCVFTGRGRLPQRPMSVLTDEMKKHGVVVNDGFPIEIDGKLEKGKYYISAAVSSQFITGLLLALPQVGGGEIILTGNLQSKSYIDITLSVMEKFGVRVTETENGYIVPNRSFEAASLRAEGDWSNAAFFLSCGAEVLNLDYNSKQGDRKITEILETLESERKDVFIDVSDVPDLVPVICVKAAVRQGRTHIINAERLKLKESDRILSSVAMINSLGGSAKGDDNSIVIDGKPRLCGGCVDSFNDHRIAMAAAVASQYCENEVTIIGAQAVNKSYPDFFEDFKKLGGICNVV